MNDGHILLGQPVAGHTDTLHIIVMGVAIPVNSLASGLYSASWMGLHGVIESVQASSVEALQMHADVMGGWHERDV